MNGLVWLDDDVTPFPDVAHALSTASGANGLLAASAHLTLPRLLQAYRHGIFPWYSPDQPVLWWSPDPRMVLRPAAFKVSASLRKILCRVLRDPAWEIRVDADFAAVMHACANTARPGQAGTWITEDMVAAYTALHAVGFAHSVETWYQGQRVGGLYGVGIGAMMFGESMYTHLPNASKIALAALVGHAGQHGAALIDCQQHTAHLASLGATAITRERFLAELHNAIEQSPIPWHFDKMALQWTTHR
jgi:leucyl/phenylalanyl-tRNA--protein transferase